MLTWIPISSQIVEIATPSTKCRRIARTFSSPSKCRRVFPFSLIDNPPHPYPLTMQRISVIVHFQERQHNTIYRWKKRYGHAIGSAVPRNEAADSEVTKLRDVVVDLVLDIHNLKQERSDRATERSRHQFEAAR